jgi:ubiquinone/menaquinone biosynthesis C-methylase UbiE
MKGTWMKNASTKTITGTAGTRAFYDEIGWKEQNGASVDRHLFGVKEDGPIRVELNHLHKHRIRTALAKAGKQLNLLECGCGGHPEKQLFDLCEKYTGVDFSDTGLEMARSSVADVGITHRFQTADVCALPFDDGAFCAVYSAHMIYHIEDPTAQNAAINELMRVTKPGGVVVLVAANPRPLAFPIRLLLRVAADTPLIGSTLKLLRTKSPVPYKPMPIEWMRRRLARWGSVEVLGCSIPTTSFYQNVTEFKGAGKLLWTAIRWLDVNYPQLSAYFGNYVLLTCTRAV